MTLRTSAMKENSWMTAGLNIDDIKYNHTLKTVHTGLRRVKPRQGTVGILNKTNYMIQARKLTYQIFIYGQ